MKVSYKKIRVVWRRPYIVDHYYSLVAEDFLDDEQILEMEQNHIRRVLSEAKYGKHTDYDIPFIPDCFDNEVYL